MVISLIFDFWQKILGMKIFELFNHDVNVSGGLLESECSQLLKDFFKELREVDKAKKL